MSRLRRNCLLSNIEDNVRECDVEVTSNLEAMIKIWNFDRARLAMSFELNNSQQYAESPRFWVIEHSSGHNMHISNN